MLTVDSSSRPQNEHVIHQQSSNVVCFLIYRGRLKYPVAFYFQKRFLGIFFRWTGLVTLDPGSRVRLTGPSDFRLTWGRARRALVGDASVRPGQCESLSHWFEVTCEPLRKAPISAPAVAAWQIFWQTCFWVVLVEIEVFCWDLLEGDLELLHDFSIGFVQPGGGLWPQKGSLP